MHGELLDTALVGNVTMVVEPFLLSALVPKFAPKMVMFVLDEGGALAGCNAVTCIWS